MNKKAVVLWSMGMLAMVVGADVVNFTAATALTIETSIQFRMTEAGTYSSGARGVAGVSLGPNTTDSTQQLDDAREASNGWNLASDDTDGDGMDNDGEIQYGFDPLAEHIALTDPTNRFDYFVIDGVGEAVVSVDAKVGRTYTLRTSTNLVSNVWKTVDTQSATEDGPLVLTDTNEFATAIYKVNV